MNPFSFADGEFRWRGAPFGFDHAERLLASLEADAAEPSYHQAHDRRMAAYLRQALADAQPERQAA
ncbi:hypothetical protein [Phenylobacterium sp.]|uniref:hypothetical protein n=1 Tax=Phenylobacterium sp. TaxID=1871053 RepID=UPI002FCBC538